MATKIRVLIVAGALSGALGCATTAVGPTAPEAGKPGAEKPGAAAAAPEKKVPAGPPTSITDPVTGMELLFVKGGCFPMGNAFTVGGPEEKPVHEVCVDDLYVGKFEVTQREWKKVMGNNPSSNAKCGDLCPVDGVSWKDAQEFLAKLNAASGVGPLAYRLPTEAEWEYAARSGGKAEKYPGAKDDDVGNFAWYLYDTEAIQPVGTKLPNGLGLHDMAGNVWEWTGDWFGESFYGTSPKENPTGPEAGTGRVLRGGSFSDETADQRTTFRNYLAPDYRGVGKGLRIVKPTRAAPPAATVATSVAAPGATPAAAAPAPAPEAPKVHKDPATGMELVFVKGGCFQMGNTFSDGKGSYQQTDEDAQGEEPVHEVCVGDYYIGKFEVTQGQWKAIMGNTPTAKSHCDGKNLCRAPNCPMGNVSWADVQAFISKLNARAGGKKFRLPTEAEWEYAARSGGKNQKYAGGNDVDAVAWYDANSGARVDPHGQILHPVGQKAPNGLGLYDMSGNMWEMTGDWYSADYYSKSPRDNPKGPATGTEHTKRGGCATGPSTNMRTARRSQFDGVPCDSEGFRMVRIP
jgi:sulfatase modifying factor 1